MTETKLAPACRQAGSKDRPNMQNKKLIRFVESFILMPLATVSLPLGGLSTTAINLATDTISSPQAVLSQKLNIEANGFLAYNQAMDLEAKLQEETRQLKADAIDTYFEARSMPLAGYGMKMVLEAEKNDLDWRLLPAISVIETTGGKNLCKSLPDYKDKNPFGWGSCRIGFESFDEAIEIVAWNLGGNNPNTDHHYEGKNTEQIINTFNLPSIVPSYDAKIMKVMNTIGAEDIGVTISLTS